MISCADNLIAQSIIKLAAAQHQPRVFYPEGR
jgi:hypothetical protein